MHDTVISKKQIKGAIKSFNKFVCDLASHDNGVTVLKPIEAIKNYYAYNNLDYDDYYDFETLDRVLWINAAYLCISKIIDHKEIYLEYFDDNIEIDVIRDIYEGQMENVSHKEKIILLRNCFCHNHFDITAAGNIRIKRTTEYGNLELGFPIAVLYALVKELDTNLYYLRFTPSVDKSKVESTVVSTVDEAYEYCMNLLIASVTKGYNEEIHYINKMIQLNEDEFKNGLEYTINSTHDAPELEDNIVAFLNQRITLIYEDANKFSSMYGSLFDLIDTIRFFLIYYRQDALKYDYPMLKHNYNRFYFKMNPVDPLASSSYCDMYEPRVKEKIELMRKINFYYEADSRNRDKFNAELYNELIHAVQYYAVFTFLPLLQEQDLYFPFDKLIVHNEFLTKGEEDIKRHLRNSTQHHNYKIENERIIIYDYNTRSMKKTFSAELPSADFNEAVESAYFHIPFELPFYD